MNFLIDLKPIIHWIFLIFISYFVSIYISLAFFPKILFIFPLLSKYQQHMYNNLCICRYNNLYIILQVDVDFDLCGDRKTIGPLKWTFVLYQNMIIQNSPEPPRRIYRLLQQRLGAKISFKKIPTLIIIEWVDFICVDFRLIVFFFHLLSSVFKWRHFKSVDIGYPILF